jgi:hypothetical protein
MKFLSAIIGAILFFAVGVTAETTNTLSDAEIQGRQLVRQLLAQQPAENFTNTGVLKIRPDQGKTVKLPAQFAIVVTPTHWTTIYEASGTNRTEKLSIVHTPNQPNQYVYQTNSSAPMADTEIVTPFAGSDFWLADLGLEFFQWPAQKVLPKPTNLSNGRDYTLLESTSPHPAANGYSRVVSWIDKESGGILEAEAYDAHNKLLKQFYPKDFKKINGQWQVLTMEINNIQTGSRTRLEFDLQSK